MTHRLRFDFGLWRLLEAELILLINVLDVRETDPASGRNMLTELSLQVDMPTEACRYAFML